MDAAKIAQITDKKGLRNLMANARRHDREDIYWLAFKQLCSLEGMSFDDPMERDFYDVLNAYEELLTHLSEMEECFRRHRRLKKIAFLIARSHGAFVVTTLPPGH